VAKRLERFIKWFDQVAKRLERFIKWFDQVAKPLERFILRGIYTGISRNSEVK